MPRIEQHFHVSDTEKFKSNALDWGQNYETVVWLDSNQHDEKHSQHSAIIALGREKSIRCSYQDSFEKLKKFQATIQDYCFGFLGYDLKNDIENLSSDNHDGLEFPDLFFFQPKKLIFISKEKAVFKYLNVDREELMKDFQSISNHTEVPVKITKKKLSLNFRIQKEAYLNKVRSILNHIHRGDIYEANFCQEFYAENSVIDPLEVYKNLNQISKPPFATYLKFDNNFLLSASPERYLKKNGRQIISQPIKGTARRSSDKQKDLALKEALRNDPKERAENIMIVDLVRNDLSRIALKGSVQVEELCKVYSFKQVHQMISSIVSEIPENIHPVDIIKNSYPMGSMTGAPKVKAMKIIEDHEETKRSLYSGAVGYFTPEGNFDFNVIIRSILYNQKNKYVSCSVGSAITSLSVPEKEFEECLLKAKALREVLHSS
jgi:para-aminobenzoate synthetase component 1